ncbi:hypothetical protein [Salipaludibacillus sp. CF4.18]|uniref:hypothetical protein n=1 Tax=Salipaludibacillus sp. CF4.18 TaxID=3373081 RepID=UPI003EE74E72
MDIFKGGFYISQTIWRYMSLAKYVELLRSQSLYFPKASRFDDETEGQWIAHSLLVRDLPRLTKLPTNTKIVKGILERAGDSESAMYREVEKVLKDGNINSLLKESLDRLIFYFTLNRGKFDAQNTLEGNVEAWTNQINMHSESKEKTMSQVKAHRESTYINCWNSNEAMSLAMWQLFGGGVEAVAIRTTKAKLETVLCENKNELEASGYESGVSKVHYLPNLKNPEKKQVIEPGIS